MRSTSYDSWVWLHENPDDELHGHFKKPRPVSVQAEKQRYFDELREKIGEEEFLRREADYNNRNARIQNED